MNYPCDVNGKRYRIGDQYRLAPQAGGMNLPSFEAELGPCTILYIDTETPDGMGQYVSGRPGDPVETSGWDVYKLAELTTHRNTRVSPDDVRQMIEDSREQGATIPDGALAAVVAASDFGIWNDDE